VPIYEYRCQQCGADFEQLVRSSDDKVRCPKCFGRRVRRKLSVFAMSSSNKESARPVSLPGPLTGRSSCASCHASSCSGCHR
jgi:putative FmdB family regulatory protein